MIHEQSQFLLVCHFIFGHNIHSRAANLNVKYCIIIYLQIEIGNKISLSKPSIGEKKK